MNTYCILFETSGDYELKAFMKQDVNAIGKLLHVCLERRSFRMT